MIDQPGIDVRYKGTQTDEVISVPSPSRRLGEQNRAGVAAGVLAKAPEGPGPCKLAMVRGFCKTAISAAAAAGVGRSLPKMPGLKINPGAAPLGGAGAAPATPASAAPFANPFAPRRARRIDPQAFKAQYHRVQQPGLAEPLFVDRKSGRAGVLRGSTVDTAPKDPIQRAHLNQLTGSVTDQARHQTNVATGRVAPSAARSLAARAGALVSNPLGQIIAPMAVGKIGDMVMPRDQHGRKFSETQMGGMVSAALPMGAPALSRWAAGPRTF